MRSGYTYLLHNATRVTSINITIHAASFMGFTEFDGRGGHVYQGCRLVRQPPNFAQRWGSNSVTPMWAANADAFHSSGVKNGPTLDNVELSFSVDDFVNVHSRLQSKRLVMLTWNFFLPVVFDDFSSLCFFLYPTVFLFFCQFPQ